MKRTLVWAAILGVLGLSAIATADLLDPEIYEVRTDVHPALTGGYELRATFDFLRKPFTSITFRLEVVCQTNDGEHSGNVLLAGRDGDYSGSVPLPTLGEKPRICELRISVLDSNTGTTGPVLHTVCWTPIETRQAACPREK